MIRKFCLTLAVISTAFVSMVSAQQTGKVTASGIGYLEYLPQGYHSNSNKYPVVISLHGIKEKGTSSTDRQRVLRDLEKVDNVGLPKYVRQGTKYPFILISPQLKSNLGAWPASFVMEVVNHVRKNLRIDDRRIYLTGLSLGGFGVWKTAGEYPDVFAAIAPICAGGNALSKADDIAREGLPVWGFHGTGDKIVTYRVTTNMVDAINSAPKKPSPLAKATLYPGLGHVIWDKVYQQTDVLDWMLRHRKGSRPSDDDDDENENDNNGGNEHGGDDDDEEESPSNMGPVVDAGPDRTLELPANFLDLQGSANDKDGKIASVRWTKVSGGSASLNGANRTKLRAYNLAEGTYVFRLTAKDNDGATQSDEVHVIVKKVEMTEPPKDDENEEPKGKNILPAVYAGPDRVITLPDNSINIEGNATDKDGRVVSYEWAKTYGHRAILSGEKTSTVNISGLQRGIYIFRLRATDNDGGVKDDFFKITVNESGKKSKEQEEGNNKPDPSNKSNRAPYANAGPDRVISLPTNELTIQGRATDRDGKVVSYDWAKTYGGRVSFSGRNSPRVKLSDLQRGIYIFRLTVKDNDGAVTHDYFKVTVKDSGEVSARR